MYLNKYALLIDQCGYDTAVLFSKDNPTFEMGEFIYCYCFFCWLGAFEALAY